MKAQTTFSRKAASRYFSACRFWTEDTFMRFGNQSRDSLFLHSKPCQNRVCKAFLHRYGYLCSTVILKNFEISKWTYMNSDSRQGYRTSEQHRVEPERKCYTLPLATERKYWYLPVKPTYITERWWSISFVSSTDVELPWVRNKKEAKWRLGKTAC